MPTPPLSFRAATAADAPAIAEIYNHAVLHTTAIWNDLTVDADNRAQWLTQRQADGFAVLVATDETGQVLGYAAYGPWRSFDGYRHTVENSIYVHPGAHRRGVGRQLLAALIERAQQQGLHVMVAAIEAGNAPSIALHAAQGFVETGRMAEVGCKFGRWLDLVFLQRKLSVDAQPPMAQR